VPLAPYVRENFFSHRKTLQEEISAVISEFISAWTWICSCIVCSFTVLATATSSAACSAAAKMSQPLAIDDLNNQPERPGDLDL